MNFSSNNCPGIIRVTRGIRTQIVGHLAVLVALVASSSGVIAQDIIVNIETELVSMNLTGEDEVPLGTDVGNTLNLDGFHPVTTLVTVTESMLFASTGEITIRMNETDVSDPNNLLVTGTIDSQFDFYLDLAFQDVDPNFDFDSELGNSFTLGAPAVPLSVSLSGDFAFSLNDILAGSDPTIDSLGVVSSSSTAIYQIGADINNNGENDLMKLSASDLEFGLEDLSFDNILLSDEELLGFVSGTLTSDIETSLSGDLSITSTTLTFDGDVLDASTDPPFALTVSGASSTAIPEPTGVPFAFLALIFPALRRRARRR